jgi:hypothetical protein
MIGRKVYGICLERVGQLITKAKERLNGNSHQEPVLLESYCTGNINDIVYILVLYDLKERTPEGLTKELEKIAFSLSHVVREQLSFGYTDEGHLGLYLTASGGVIQSEELAAA